MKRPRLTPVAGLIILVVLTLIVGAGNLWQERDQFNAYKASQARAQAAQQRQAAAAQAAQRREAELVERKLCTSFGKLAALRPPPGNPADNPSRAYLQNQHDILAGIGQDIRCPQKKNR